MRLLGERKVQGESERQKGKERKATKSVSALNDLQVCRRTWLGGSIGSERVGSDGDETCSRLEGRVSAMSPRSVPLAAPAALYSPDSVHRRQTKKVR